MYWIARLQGHFPARQTENDAVVKADVAGYCVDEGLSICALAWECDELWQEATKKDPFMPPSGEIIQRTRERTQKWCELLQAYENAPIAEIEKQEVQEPDPKANDGPDAAKKVEIMKRALRWGQDPNEALKEAGYSV